jgi:hypothetical protein
MRIKHSPFHGMVLHECLSWLCSWNSGQSGLVLAKSSLRMSNTGQVSLLSFLATLNMGSLNKLQCGWRRRLADSHSSYLFIENLHKSIAENQVTKVVINLLQWRCHIQNLSCDCCNHLIKSGTIHNYSLRPIWLLHQPNQLVKWSYGRNIFSLAITKPLRVALMLAVSPEMPYCLGLLFRGFHFVLSINIILTPHMG